MGSNITSIPTATIQTNLGIKSDGNYGPQTTAAVQAFQTANGLKADGIFGPQTMAAYNTKYSSPTASSLIATSGASRTSFTQNSSDLAKAEQALGLSPAPTTTPTTTGTPGSSAPGTPTTGTPTATQTPDATPDPILAGIASLQTTNDNATNALVASTQASYQSQIAKQQQNNDAYISGLKALGIQTGEAQTAPDLLSGHIQQAAQDGLDKINALKATEAKTIMDAKTAQSNNDFKALEDATTQLKNIQTAKAQAIKDLNTTITQSPKLASAQIDPDTAQQMLTTMQTLDPADQQSFIEAIASKFGISPLTVVASLNSITTASNKAALATKNATATLDNKVNPKAKTPSAGSISKDQISQGEAYLDGTRGSDKFVDPAAYEKAYNDFLAKGGTTKGFLAAYPPKDYVNPENTDLPKYLMPAKTKAASGRSS